MARKYQKVSELLPVIKELSAQGKTQEQIAKQLGLSSAKDYEPHLALHGGDDGLVFYRSIAQKYAAALKPGGYLCFEFGAGQGDDVCRILAENGYEVLERVNDFNDRERAVLAQLREE